MGNQTSVPKLPKDNDANSSFVSESSGITSRCNRARDSVTISRCVLKPVESSVNTKSNGLLDPNTSKFDLLDVGDNECREPPITSQPNRSRHKKRSSLLVVNNGITGKFISSRICKIAAAFWQTNIESLSTSDQLEIGCSIFFGMMATGNMKKLMKSNIASKSSIECTSLKYLDMMGWLIRHLITDNIDLHSLLYKLGGFHQSMGINISHFSPMLQSMHETFAYYFEEKYNIEIKYALDEIFSLAAQFMTGESLKCSSHLMDINKQFQGSDIPFLKSLDVCLKCDIGKEYLYRYLSQNWCDEIVIFLNGLSRFKLKTTDKERFFVARDIAKHSIDEMATFSLNLSYENRMNSLRDMAVLESIFASKMDLKIPVTFFQNVEIDILKLVLDNHWIRFRKEIRQLQSKSFNME